VAGLPCAGHAKADQGPLLVAEPTKLDVLYLEPPQAWLDLKYFRDDETQKSNAVTNHFTEDQFQEILTLKTTGYIEHPNLVDLKLQGSFGLEQDLLDEDGKKGTENGTFYGWDLNATILRKEELPITVFSRRTEDYFNQPFGPSLQSTFETDGIIFDWQNKTVPTRIEYDHLTEDQKALDGLQNFQETEDVVTWHSSYQPTKQDRSSFDYTLNTGTTSNNGANFGGQTGTDFTDHTISLTNELDFGPNAADYLQSSLNYLNQSGTYEFSDLRYNENLYLQHSDNFSTSFSYLLDKENVGGSFGAITDQLLQRGDAQATYHLFKSLVAVADLSIQRADIEPSGGDTDYSGALSFDYTKLVPLGKFSANLGLSYDQTDNDASGQETHIINQQQVFHGTTPLIITANNIIAGSLMISDSTGIRVYRPGLDYVVRSFPNYLEIERILGGNIQDGQTVLISYNVAAQPANTVRTNSLSLGGRYQFDVGPLRGLGLYAQYIDQSQSVPNNFDESFTPNSLVDKLIGADYQVGELRFLAEQDWHHSSIAPYNQFRADARWTHPISDRAGFTLETGYLMAKYLQTNDMLTDFTVAASANYQFSSELSVNGSVQYQDQDDRLFGPTRGMQEELEVQWSHRNTTAYIQFRNSNIRYNILTNQVQTIQIGIRRTF